LNNRRKPDDKDLNRPRLRMKSGTGTIDESGSDDSKDKKDADERPTLKRRN